jgi:hypothetical protein
MRHCALLVRGIALHGVDNNDGVQVVKHSRNSRRSLAACGLQLRVSFSIFCQSFILCGKDLGSRLARETASTLLGGNFANHVR